MEKHEESETMLTSNKPKVSLLLRSQVTYYLWKLHMCLWRERTAIGIAAPATAKQEIPCQEVHHYIRAHVQSPRDGDQAGNQTKC